jgi:hypothetical protein
LAPQAAPQAPQLLGSEPVVTQVPEQQVVPVGHLWPQLPQLLLLIWRFTQVPEQLTVPEGQGQKPLVQVPLQHVLEALHAAPAAAHFVGAAANASVAPAREGNTAEAIPAARIFKALRRDKGVASCLARSSNRLSFGLVTRPSLFRVVGPWVRLGAA